MIVVDTSALIAITNHEPERQRFLEILAQVDKCFFSAVTLLETRMVTLGRFGRPGTDRLSEWFAVLKPTIVAFDVVQADAAFAAFQIYGKGVHPKARLNMGDCAAYALAKTYNLPLLFKGEDFLSTDVASGNALNLPTENSP